MSTAYAVIGAGFGDEGKGLVTDYLARKLTRNEVPPLVARGNGGAQAGHTVVDGKRRHVFGHLSAGSFVDSTTYLGSNFIVNPLLLNKELLKLVPLRCRPDVYAHPQCRVTTIYDMAINSLVEVTRSNRHGSCGMGINETVTRHHAGFFLTFEQLKTSGFEVAKILRKIREEWVPARLKQLNIDPEMGRALGYQNVQTYLNALDTNYDDHASDLRRFGGMIRLGDPKSFNDMTQDMIVEGAQGLMLDEFMGEFPHVTRSVTGLPSSILTAAECGYFEVQPVYVTRAYATRHGAGRFKYEGERITDTKLQDTTNVDNPWQGSLRYAPLDLTDLRKFIHDDYLRATKVAQLWTTKILPPKLVLTCLDQLGENVSFFSNGVHQTVRTSNLPKILEDALDMRILATSHGPTAKDVRVPTE